MALKKSQLYSSLWQFCAELWDDNDIGDKIIGRLVEPGEAA